MKRPKPVKRILLSLILLLSVGPKLGAQAAPDAAKLTKLLKDFLAGAGRNDAAMHERFWADDLIYTASAGRRIGKPDILRDVKAEGPPKANRRLRPLLGPASMKKQCGFDFGNNVITFLCSSNIQESMQPIIWPNASFALR